MRTVIDFTYRFHPVGQGLFCTGTLVPPEENSTPFHWTFDCGSMAKKADWISQVEWYRDLVLQNDILNLLCISHFDKDHVSGLAELLKDRHVDTVVIPYYTPVERLVLGAMQDRRRERDNGQYDNFLSNPVAFLLEHAASINQIIIVHRSPPENPDWPFGGPQGPDDPTRGLTDRPLAPDLFLKRPRPIEAKERWRTKIWLSEQRETEPHFAQRLRNSITGWSGHLIFCGEKCHLLGVDLAIPTFLPQWEFMFFHKPESPDDIPKLIWDIDEILWEEATNGGTRPDLENALRNQNIRRKIKKAYHRAFPEDKRFNTAGLCTYSGPVKEHLTWTSISGPHVWHGIPPIMPMLGIRRRFESGLYWRGQQWRPGILYSGDADFKPALHRRELRDFLTIDRWRDICVLQVPHHGSKNNWEVGSVNEFHHHWSVFSADPQYKHHHPDQPVVIDLLRRNPLLVDRIAGIHWSGFCHFQTATKHLP